MRELKLEVIRFKEEDVIATSQGGTELPFDPSFPNANQQPTYDNDYQPN